LPEREHPWVTKTDKGKFPKGTEHVKIEDPYGVGYKGDIHIYKRPGESFKSHVDLPKLSEWKHVGDPFRVENILGSNLSPLTKIRMLQKRQEQL
jgi:hypothetical protein